MDTQMKAVLALTALGGALYGALATNTKAQAKPEVQAVKTAQKPRLQLKRLPSTNGLKLALPPLTKLDLKSLPPDALPIEFNGGTVYWIPLDEKAPVKAPIKTKTRTKKFS